MLRTCAQLWLPAILGLWLPWLPIERLGAVEVEGLYQAEVPVTGRDRPERGEAFQEALRLVLIRVTGDRDVVDTESAAPLLETAARYVRQFRYSERADKEFPYRLEVVFDGQALERAVAAQGLPVWGRRRPGTLVWLGVQDARGRYLVGGDSGRPAARSMAEVASMRGVPLVFPLLDLDDQRAVTFADVAGGFQDRILEASRRYRPDGVLVGRVAQLQGGFWRARWHLHLGGQRTEWETEGEDIALVLGAGVDRLADELAQRLATSTQAGPAAGTLIGVRGVADLKDLIAVRRYLGDLAPVSAVRPYLFAADRVEFSVEMRGDPRDLERIIGLGDVLARERDPVPVHTPSTGLGAESAPVQTSSARLVFRLRR